MARTQPEGTLRIGRRVFQHLLDQSPTPEWARIALEAAGPVAAKTSPKSRRQCV
jgi:hypothetical protein